MLLSRLKSGIKNEIAEEDSGSLLHPVDWFKNIFAGSESASGERVSTKTAVLHPDVYACVIVLADDIAKLPIKLFQNQNGNIQQVQNKVSDIILNKVNDYMTSFVWKRLLVTRLCTWGNSYNLLLFDKDGNVTGIRPLDPEATNTNIDPDNGRVWYSTTIDGRYREFFYEEVLHFKNLSLDGIVGQTPISVIRDNIGSNRAATKFNAKFYKNGGAPFGVVKAPTLLDRKSKQILREDWERVNAGQSIAVLDAGLDYSQVTMPMKDAQFIESMKWNRQQIASIYKVPPHKIGELDRATFSNIEQQSLDYVKTTLQPIVTNIEQELNDKVLTEKQRGAGYYFKFNLESELRGDSKSRAEFYKTMQSVGAFSVNTILQKEDMTGIGEIGDEHYGNLNLVPLSIMKEYQLNKTKRTSDRLKGGDGNGTEEEKQVLEHEGSE
ncbi:phage portal protein [Bacillus licheniformis]|uniref:phage portal protein n=2 Tax=Bacillus licheniformis TaxID=1402 RepID=UPI0008FB25EC|nr:phage portal protein [Bacillus licheniformis]OIS84170.1 phage portal protein [Bacillus licheniformis]